MNERLARWIRRWTMATASPASGPNSGPTTIAPMIRICESVKIPQAAINVARTMNARKVTESSALSEVRASTCSQTTASAGDPFAACSARTAASEIVVSTSPITMLPCFPEAERPELLDHDARVLPGDVAEDHVPARLERRAGQVDDVDHDGQLREEIPNAPGEAGRDDDAQVNHGPGAYSRPAVLLSARARSARQFRLTRGCFPG